MSEEEKKAIEVLKSKRASEQLMISGKMCVDILLNLIEKQQKELEQEQEKNKNLIKQLQEQNTEIQDISKQLREKEQEDIKMRAKFVLSLDNYISKDNIRAKIKELENLIETNSLYEECWNKIEVLKELLEEN